MALKRVMLLLATTLLGGCHLAGLNKVFVPPKPSLPAAPWSSNNSAALYVGPQENTAVVRDVISRARQTLFVETYELADDALGDEIVTLLQEATQRGVKVFVLCDSHGSASKGGEQLGKRLISSGGHFRMWPTRTTIDQEGRRNFNVNHRKLYLADGDRGVTGGYNLTSPFNTTTRDLLVDFRGEVAAQLHREFARDWQMAGGTSPSWPDLPPGAAYGSAPARVIVTSPLEGRFEAQEAIYRAVEGAQRNIEIEQQFLWESTLVDKLLQAARRGVAVRVIVPGRSEGPLFRNLHAATLNMLVQAGGQARRYQGRPASAHLHTKYFSVDDRWAAIGSVNGNTRALKNNQELDVETTDPRLIADLKARLFEPDWTNHSMAYQQDNAFWLHSPFLPVWANLSQLL